MLIPVLQPLQAPHQDITRLPRSHVSYDSAHTDPGFWWPRTAPRQARHREETRRKFKIETSLLPEEPLSSGIGRNFNDRADNRSGSPGRESPSTLPSHPRGLWTLCNRSAVAVRYLPNTQRNRHNGLHYRKKMVTLGAGPN
jgi:hypothetical protein